MARSSDFATAVTLSMLDRLVDEDVGKDPAVLDVAAIRGDVAGGRDLEGAA